MNIGGSARGARAALFALVCVAAGTGLHRLADGCDPGLVGPALALPLIWLGAYGLARRERSTPFIVLALGAAQLGLHFELGLFCPPSTPAPAFVEAPGTAGVQVQILDAPGMPAMPGMSASAGTHGLLAMLLAHVLAVLVCGWWLGRGERAFFELCRAVNGAAARTAGRIAILLRTAAAACRAAASILLAAATALPPRRVPPPWWWRTARPRPAVPAGPRVLRGPPCPSLSR